MITDLYEVAHACKRGRREKWVVSRMSHQPSLAQVTAFPGGNDRGILIYSKQMSS